MELSRSTLAGWVGQRAALHLLVDALARHVLAGTVLHADDTPVPVLAPGGGRPRTGPLWMHVRRKFFDIHAADNAPLATEAVQRIAALYAVERDIAGRPPDARPRARKARAGPALDALHAWLTATLARVSSRGDLTGTIRYALTRWVALTRYRDDGRVAIVSNAAKRAIQPKCAAFAAGPLVLGRKSWLFAGSDAGGSRAATIASLLETAKLNGIDPAAYLRHVLSTMAHFPVNRVAELLPWAVTGLPIRLDQT